MGLPMLLLRKLNLSYNYRAGILFFLFLGIYTISITIIRSVLVAKVDDFTSGDAMGLRPTPGDPMQLGTVYYACYRKPTEYAVEETQIKGTKGNGEAEHFWNEKRWFHGRDEERID
ncbi:hypothetical protein EDC01DRAFT_627449 [Geopyxis carbonaria]|nr:hypothetical protein EDC01DRAFT_627449 [Geopyxis carbonaria]